MKIAEDKVGISRLNPSVIIDPGMLSVRYLPPLI